MNTHPSPENNVLKNSNERERLGARDPQETYDESTQSYSDTKTAARTGEEEYEAGFSDPNFMKNFKKYSKEYRDNESSVPGIDNDFGTDEGGTTQWIGLRNLDPDREGTRATPPPFSESHSGGERKGFQPEAELLRRGVMEILAEAKDIDASDIEVNATNGIVSLEGTVPVAEMSRTIENYAAAIPGVESVENRIITASDSLDEDEEEEQGEVENNSSDSHPHLTPSR